MYPVDDAPERAQVESVFGLTGGELEDKPLRYLEAKLWHDGEPTGEHARRWARYWYRGAPDYAPELERLGDVITIVWDRLYAGIAPPKIRAQGREWRKVGDFRSSGEAPCLDAGSVAQETCTICEAEPGDRHGYVYVGDGWYETIYRAR